MWSLHLDVSSVFKQVKKKYAAYDHLHMIVTRQEESQVAVLHSLRKFTIRILSVKTKITTCVYTPRRIGRNSETARNNCWWVGKL